MTPSVSAIIPTRNRRHELQRALESIAAQRFRDFEIVVIDDGSVDGTAAWVRAQWPLVSLIEVTPPIGAAAARNLGIKGARGEIVAFLDDDDIWLSSYLEIQVAQFQANLDAEMCTSGHFEVGPSGKASWPELSPMSLYPNELVEFLAACPVHTLSVVACRRSAFERIGFLEETLSIVHDLDWYVRLIVANGVIRRSSEALVQRSIPGGLVTRHRLWFSEERKVQQSLFAAGLCLPGEQRLIRVSRALFFARLGFERGDLIFGFSRLFEAFLASPRMAASIATRRVARLLLTKVAGTQMMRRKEAP